MKVFAVLFSLVISATSFAQTTRSFGSVVFPGGTSSTSPGISRNFGSSVFPGGAAVPVVRGGAPAIAARPTLTNQVPAQAGNSNFRRNPGGGGRNTRGTSYVYAYPVYVGAYDNNGSAPQDEAPAPPQQNVIVVYPPPQRATPVMIQAGPDGEFYSTGPRPGATVYEAPRRAEAEPEPATEPNRYLIAFKDHTIYSAVAYWADGDTLHYFTSGNTHNQVSVSLIDRTLTERLNREMGTDFKLPPAK